MKIKNVRTRFFWTFFEFFQEQRVTFIHTFLQLLTGIPKIWREHLKSLSPMDGCTRTRALSSNFTYVISMIRGKFSRPELVFSRQFWRYFHRRVGVFMLVTSKISPERIDFFFTSEKQHWIFPPPPPFKLFNLTPDRRHIFVTVKYCAR